jgi:hypothetical protein
MRRACAQRQPRPLFGRCPLTETPCYRAYQAGAAPVGDRSGATLLSAIALPYCHLNVATAGHNEAQAVRGRRCALKGVEPSRKCGATIPGFRAAYLVCPLLFAFCGDRFRAGVRTRGLSAHLRVSRSRACRTVRQPTRAPQAAGTLEQGGAPRAPLVPVPLRPCERRDAVSAAHF